MPNVNDKLTLLKTQTLKQAGNSMGKFKPNWKRGYKHEQKQEATPFSSFHGAHVHKYPRQYCPFNYKTGEFDINGVKGRINRMGGIIEIHTGDYILDQHFRGQDLRIVIVTLPQFMG